MKVKKITTLSSGEKIERVMSFTEKDWETIRKQKNEFVKYEILPEKEHQKPKELIATEGQFDYSSLSHDELKGLAKDRKIKGSHLMGYDKLIEELNG